MSRENVVISMDGHTEAFLDLKSWMPSPTHAAFDEAMAEGRRTFMAANRFWADLVYAGTEFAWESANELVTIDAEKYHQVMTCEQRLANIDADGVAAEILIGKTILEALNTDLVCDAINTAMSELFLQIAYGRSQSAFSEGGLPIGAGLEDLGKGLRSQVGTMFATLKKGPRYLEMAEGYVTRLAVDKEGAIIGYEFVSIGKMMDAIKKGVAAAEALEKAKGTYGRFAEAAKYVDPRHE